MVLGPLLYVLYTAELELIVERHGLRLLLVPRTHNKLGDRSFSAAGPRLWNDLPPGLRRPGLIPSTLLDNL